MSFWSCTTCGAVVEADIRDFHDEWHKSLADRIDAKSDNGHGHMTLNRIGGR